MNQTLRYLCFNLGNEEFALPLLSVREVIGMPKITPIPQSPQHFVGIMDLRGLVISVMDLRLRINIKPIPSDETAVIILDLGGQNLGIVVDKVNAVVELGEKDISNKPATNESKVSEAVAGVFKKDEHLVLLLDIGKILSVEDRSILNRAA